MVRRWLYRVALFLLLAPLVLVAVYRVILPPLTPLMLIRTVQGEGWDYRPTRLADIAPTLQRAVIASEDMRFCTHHGFDTVELRAAIADWQNGDSLRGASTISMQTARNIVLWPGGGMVRKALEVWPTLLLELFWPKERILETYLNIAEFGPGIYGAEAAARSFFGVSAADLNARQAALLTAALPAPRSYSVGAPSSYLRERAALIVRRMQDVTLGNAGTLCPS